MGIWYQALGHTMHVCSFRWCYLSCFFIMMMIYAFAAVVFNIGCSGSHKFQGFFLFKYAIGYLSLAVIVSTFISSFSRPTHLWPNHHIFLFIFF